jgi:hypothetical protein
LRKGGEGEEKEGEGEEREGVRGREEQGEDKSSICSGCAALFDALAKAAGLDSYVLSDEFEGGWRGGRRGKEGGEREERGGEEREDREEREESEEREDRKEREEREEREDREGQERNAISREGFFLTRANKTP